MAKQKLTNSKILATLVFPGDIILTASNSWLGRQIRKREQVSGEPKARVNHAAIVVSPMCELARSTIVEALKRVMQHGMLEAYGGSDDRVAIFRYKGWDYGMRLEVATRAQGMVGRKYGWLKIVCHDADYWLSRMVGREVFVARRLCRNGRYPICSWVVADAYQYRGVKFRDLDKSVVSPDDIWDHVNNNLDFIEVLPLTRIPRA